MNRRLMLIVALAGMIGASFAPAAAPSGGKRYAVEIKDLKYVPTKLTIKAGDTVVWTNKDDNDHTVIASDDSFKSDKLGNGESYKFTFSKTGTFKYGCSYHPRMKGTITVE